MKHTTATLCVVLLVVTSVLEVQGATLKGVTMPDTTVVGGKTLVLNGLGLRSKLIVSVYVAGLYLEQRSADAAAIIKSNAPKKIALQFIHGVSKAQLADSFAESFMNNSRDAMNSLQRDIDRWLGALDSVKAGDALVFTFVPGTGTTMALNGHDKLTIADPAFATVLLSVWLGPKPPTAAVKKGLLGG